MSAGARPGHPAPTAHVLQLPPAAPQLGLGQLHSQGQGAKAVLSSGFIFPPIEEAVGGRAREKQWSQPVSCPWTDGPWGPRVLVFPAQKARVTTPCQGRGWGAGVVSHLLRSCC